MNHSANDQVEAAQNSLEVQEAVDDLSRQLLARTALLDGRVIHPSRVLDESDLALLAGPAGLDVINELRTVSFRQYEETCKLQAELEDQMVAIKQELRSRGNVLDFVEELFRGAHHGGVRCARPL